ncbi:MAG: hypothetical protein LBN25_05120 [Christensenellaceae bacterium]|jgi:flavodoxin|nr:hypothetical protein [Christensenellaceae bacterium]
MSTVVVYYSFSGKTKAVAEKEAAALGAELIEIKEVKKRGILSAFLSGAPKAIGGKASKILPFEADFASYERVILAFPIWAGNPVPAFNAVAEKIPNGTTVELIFTSGGGNSGKTKQKLTDRLAKREITISAFTDIKAGV